MTRPLTMAQAGDEPGVKPVRLQVSRRKGFNLQSLSLATNGLLAVNVARPSKWGNPFIVGHSSGYDFQDDGDPTPLIAALTLDQCVAFYRKILEGCILPEMHPWGHRWHRKFVEHAGCWPSELLSSLRGKNLGCFCAPDQPCHADVLLELANK